MRARSRTLGESSRPKISPLSVEQPIPLRPPISRVDPSWRDSTLTTDSSGSSLYPASSHADSLPTPKSLNNEQVFVHKATEDDVSYRLRLLVNNNYFLPPAHAKPTPADFRPPVSASESSPRQGGFMDLFKSAKRSPGLPPESMNRTNSDSNVPRARAKSVDPTQRRRPGTAPSIPPPRVAVLREQLPDLSQAARQAAKDIRSRPPPPPSQPYQDINPTDTVDVPPPSSDYPFPVQASNLHALTVQEALGADVLAERLPPKSDEPWRRKLLQAAVGHSFSTATSPSPPTSATVSSYGSLVTRHAPGPSAGSIPSSPAPGSTTKMILGQPISIGPPVILASPPPRRASLDAGKHRYMFPQLNSPTTPTAIPPLPQGRTMGSTPLSPPPRKFSQPGPGGVHPLSSISQIEVDTAPSVNPSSGPTSSSSPSTPTSSSAPSKPSLHVPDREGLPLSMTPPPSRPNQRESEDSCVTSSSESHRAESVSSASESAYSDEEEHHPRRSLALSALRGRYDHVGSRRSESQATDDGTVEEEEEESELSYLTAESVHSPTTSSMPKDDIILPPRASSSFSQHRQALSPPPRQSSLGFIPPVPLRNPARRSPTLAKLATRRSHSDSGHGFSPESTPVRLQFAAVPGIIVEPGPTTPPFPSSSTPSYPPLPNILTATAPVSGLKSAPPVAASFFDSLPASMTGLDDSDDEDYNSQNDLPPLVPPPSLTRFGNHSSPSLHGGVYGNSGYNSSQSSLVGSSSSIKSSKSSRSFFRWKKKNTTPPPLPVAHIKEVASFFKEVPNAVEGSSSHHAMHTFSNISQHSLVPPKSPLGTSVNGKPAVLSPMDVARASMSSSRASDDGGARSGKKEFDGLLQKHMKTERDVIKQITERNAQNTGKK